jgi:hypothetical protein
MFEHRHEKLLPRHLFLRRLAKYALISLGIIIASLVAGMIGYHVFASFSWVDSFLNAAMLMGGMGPVGARIQMREKYSREYTLCTVD